MIFQEEGYNEWEAYRSWFGSLDPMLQLFMGILTIIVVVGLIVLAFYGVGKLLQGVFMLVGWILKITFFGVIVLHYTLLAILLIIPLKILAGRTIGEAFKDYGNNVKRFAQNVFENKKIENKNDEKSKATETVKQTVIVQPIVVQSAPQAIPKTHIQTIVPPTTHAAALTPNDIVFHCTHCGQAFTTRMRSVLTQTNHVHCEACGQYFILENNMPLPVESH